jgi:hypothetical protein
LNTNSRPYKKQIKDAIVALTMAGLCFSRAWFGLLFDANRYFNKLPVTKGEALALLVNIFGAALIIWLLIGFWRRCKIRPLCFVLESIFVALLILPADFIRAEYLQWTDTELLGFLKQPIVAFCALVFIALFVWKHRVFVRVQAICLGILSPLLFLIIFKLVLLCLGLFQVKQCFESDQSAIPLYPAAQGRPRVVWIIFDETDYRMAFGQRPSGLQLPEFDRLRAQSLFSENAYAPADATVISMPALISGRRLSAVSVNGCDLMLTLADTGETVSWSGFPSVFSEAHQMGFNTGLVGWAQPYSRILDGSLNYCSWYPIPLFEPARSTTFGGALRTQLLALTGPFHIRQLTIDMLVNGLADSVSLVTNANYNLILLHLPPPHSPGVYLPEKNAFTIYGMSSVVGYFNNLALADHELGVLRQAMERSGEWDKTWVILSADHSWRYSKRYDGKRDYHIPFLVKPPGSSDTTIYSRQFNTVLTHDLILAALEGKVTNRQDVAAWIDTHGQPLMPVKFFFIE